MRDEEKLLRRSKFVKNTLRDPKAVADKLRILAIGVENCRTPNDVVFALSEILFLSERTIQRDLARKIL